MSANPEYRSSLYRENIGSLFTPISYDSGSRLFFTSDSYIAACWVSNPITGASDVTADKLNMLLSLAYPPGSMLSFMLYASPDLTSYTSEMLRLREPTSFGGHPILKQAIQDKAEFFADAGTRRIDPHIFSLFRDFVIVISLKIPTSGNNLPTDKEWTSSGEMRTSVEKALQSIGLAPTPVTEHLYIHLMGTLLNWSKNSSWRTSGALYDPRQLLNEQVYDYDSSIHIDKHTLRVGEKRVKVLSPRIYPDFVSLPLMHLMIGDVQWGKDGIAGNFINCMNVYFPDAASEREKHTRKRTMVNYQAVGPMAALSSSLRERKADYEELYTYLDQGDRIVQMQHTFIVFADDDEAATAAATGLISYYRDLQYQVQPDPFIALPLFVNSLPMGADPEARAVSFFKRYRTVASGHAANLAPILGDWKGTHTPVLSYVSRLGQPMSIDLFDSDTNYNGVIAAASGSGKSFLANDAIVSYMSIGAKVFVIDVGRSYIKICEVLDGEFLVFGKDSALCINPFQLVTDFAEEGGMLVDMIRSMAAPTEPMGDWETTCIKKILSELWAERGQDIVIDDVASALLAEDDDRAKDIGFQLFPFTSKGEFGRWFVGKNNVRFDRQLTVLELEELNAKPHLQLIILLQLIYQITVDLYLGDSSIRKIVLIDESWALFSNGDVAKFMITAYRRIRKYNGAVILITQSLSDLYQNEKVGLPMMENSAWIMLLGQKAESIDYLQRTQRLSIPAGGFQLLKTVNTVKGHYSEIFFYTSSYRGSTAAAIGRLIVSRFSQLLYTTNADEKTAIRRHTERGLSLVDAINRVIHEEKSK
jgi:conjugal transfer ATP-binding protein TraC